jgi:hypothetical protein
MDFDALYWLNIMAPVDFHKESSRVVTLADDSNAGSRLRQQDSLFGPGRGEDETEAGCRQ